MAAYSASPLVDVHDTPSTVFAENRADLVCTLFGRAYSEHDAVLGKSSHLRSLGWQLALFDHDSPRT